VVAEVPQPRVARAIYEIVDQLQGTLGRFALALALPRDAFVWIDFRGDIVWCNGAFDRLVHADHLLLLGQALADRLVLERDGQKMTGERHPARRLLVDTASLAETYEMRLVDHPAVVDVIGHRGVIDGKPAAVLVIQDVTERAQAAAALRATNAQLEAANAELEAFSYSVSHDLRRPLRAIDGFSHALLEDYGAVLGEEAGGHLRRIVQAAQNMRQMIDDMLRLSRVTRGALVWADVDLAVISRAVVADLASTTPQRSVEVSIPDRLVARGDEHLLRQVLQNLLENAWKFTAKTPGARIQVGATRADGSTAYFVRDNGAGLDMARADKLFGAFQRLHTADEFPGTGIGLAIAHRIIHRHGGRIWADAAVGHGATFYFTLPSETAGRP
jgi:signal transduction histidine kinase